MSDFITNAELRIEAERLCDENEQLRLEKAALERRIDELCAEVEAEKQRNAKLRELSSIMLKCIMANKRRALICWECPAHKEFDELRSFCCIKHDAAELGIEVPS